MHLKVGVVLVIVAAAAGAAADRAIAPHVSSSRAAPAAAAEPAGTTFEASGLPAANGTTALSDGNASVSHGTHARVGRAGARADGADSGAISAASGRAVVYVAGAVARPGVYTLHAAARADDALRAAGGATAVADLVAINLAARVEDGEELAVPLKGAAATVTDGVSSHTKTRRHVGKRGHRRKRPPKNDDTAGPTDASTATDAPTEMVDVNDADESALETLPGVGPSLAQRIIAFRDLNGPFASTDELLDVGGMTAGKVDALSPYVTFH